MTTTDTSLRLSALRKRRAETWAEIVAGACSDRYRKKRESEYARLAAEIESLTKPDATKQKPRIPAKPRRESWAIRQLEARDIRQDKRWLKIALANAVVSTLTYTILRITIGSRP